MNALKKLFGGNTRQFGMIFALVALIVFFQFGQAFFRLVVFYDKIIFALANDYFHKLLLHQLQQ